MTRTTTRRTVLRGFGTLLALPWLETLAGRGAGATDAETARRLMVFTVPNGMPQSAWPSTGTGPSWTPSSLLAELGAHTERVSVLEGLHQFSWPGEPHHSLGMSLLTGRTTAAWSMADPAAFVSVDQVAARAIGGSTRLGSLQLGIDPPVPCGEVVAGTQPTCAGYWTTSWADANTPLLPILHPRAAFDRLVGSGDPGESADARARRQRLGHGVLDFVRADAARLRSRLSVSDRIRLDQYLTGVEEVERDLDALPSPETGPCADAEAAITSRVDLDAPMDHEAHVAVMLDLAVLAFQCDATRVVSFALGNERSDRTFPQLGISESHHALSHHGGDPAKLAALETIARWELRTFAGLLDRLLAAPEGAGTLLDASAVLFAGAMGDPHVHDPFNLPVIVAGGAGGALVPRGRVVYDTSVSMADLHLTLLQRLGVGIDSFGDGGVTTLPGI